MQTIFLSSGKKKCPNFSAKYNTQNQTRNYKVTKTRNFAFLYKNILQIMNYYFPKWEYFPHAN